MTEEQIKQQWRKLGFYCEMDREKKLWTLTGSRAGLLFFPDLLLGYVADSDLPLAYRAAQLSIVPSRALAEAVGQALTARAGNRQVKAEIAIASDLPAMVSGDALRLLTLFT